MNKHLISVTGTNVNNGTDGKQWLKDNNGSKVKDISSKAKTNFVSEINTAGGAANTGGQDFVWR